MTAFHPDFPACDPEGADLLRAVLEDARPAPRPSWGEGRSPAARDEARPRSRAKSRRPRETSGEVRLPAGPAA